MSESVSDLIAAAMKAGLSRTQIGRRAGCTRMQVWRVERGRTKAGSKVSRRLLAVLQPPAPDRAQTGEAVEDVMAEIETIVREDPARSKAVLDMLRIARNLG